MNSTVSNPAGNVLSEAALAAASSGDFHTLFLLVNSERVRLLDAQLIEQVSAVKSRNDQMAKLNDVLAKLNAFQAAIPGTDAGSTIKDWSKVHDKLEIALNDAIVAAGITDIGFNGKGRISETGKDGNNKEKEGLSNKSTTRGQIDAALARVKGLVDAESNNQQMDMFRMQSLNNKKNESVDLLTNGQKRYSDSVMSITRNI